MSIKNIVIFMFGAAVGAAATWRVVKMKYEIMAQEEIESAKEAIIRHGKRKDSKESDFADTEELGKDDSDDSEYINILRNEGYTNYSGITIDKEEKTVKKPYVISPDEFGEDEDYNEISLTYYADLILAEDSGEIIDNAEEIVGDALEHFGEYESDSVFVRNDTLKCDYEILRVGIEYPNGGMYENNRN